MAIWTRQPQEHIGTYQFSGKCYTTKLVAETLTDLEIFLIYQDVQQFAQQKQGIDYLQIYLDETGRKLFFIDQLNHEMVESGDYSSEDNYCTLMFASEY